LTEETGSGRILLCIDAGPRNEPGFFVDYLGTHELPGAVTKNSGSWHAELIR